MKSKESFKSLSKIILTLVFITAVIVNCGERAYAAVANLDETAVEYHELKNKLEQMLKQEQGTYGVFVIDLKSGRALGVNPLEPFHAASTFKLPLNVYLYKKIAQGEVDPQNMLVYESSHYEGGTGQLQYKPVGSSFDIETLSKYSIVYSDNVATNMLLTYLGKQNVKNYMRAAGGLVVEDNKNITCPRDMALYMKELLDFNAEQPAVTSKLIDHLENTVYNDRISKLLPDNIKVAHKVGNWPPTGTYNDVGYVQHPENPYIIAVFSKNTPGINSAFGVIQRVSKTVYDYQSNNFAVINPVFDGKTLESGIPAVLESGKVLATVRAVAEALEAVVQWVRETQ
ncbi:serine hydrolase [Desulfolucanica intricata]|uniref:serine hydrolase n=1 Tax=Desulfolucanica intricata TaxID=1285191 RepID=UPI0008348453|nr:serine hydrolase [Desulfolucanica intricata]